MARFSPVCRVFRSFLPVGWWVLGTVGLLAAAGRPAVAAEPASRAAGADRAAAVVDLESVPRLIEDLADRSFAVRQKTARRLTALGPAVKPALVAALGHPDAEVRYRVQQILAQVLEVEFENRLAAFSVDTQGTAADPAAWKLFQSMAGEGTAARQLYLEALRAEPLLLEAVEQGGSPAAEAVRLRAEQLVQRLRDQPDYRRNLPADAQFVAGAVALLIASGDRALELDEGTTTAIFQVTQYAGLVQRLSDRTSQAPLRQLVGQLITRTADTQLAYQALWISMQYHLEQGLIPATAIIRRRQRQPYVLQDAILAVGKLGSAAHIELLTPLLSDAHLVGNPFANRPGEQRSGPQVRDVALAVIIHLSGEHPQDYGFASIQPDPVRLFQIHTMGFASDQQRLAAHQKWQQRASLPAPQGPGEHAAGREPLSSMEGIKD